MLVLYLSWYLGDLDPLGSHLGTQNLGIFRNLSLVDLENTFSNQLNNKITVYTIAAEDMVGKNMNLQANRSRFEPRLQRYHLSHLDKSLNTLEFPAYQTVIPISHEIVINFK